MGACPEACHPACPSSVPAERRRLPPRFKPLPAGGPLSQEGRLPPVSPPPAVLCCARPAMPCCRTPLCLLVCWPCSLAPTVVPACLNNCPLSPFPPPNAGTSPSSPSLRLSCSAWPPNRTPPHGRWRAERRQRSLGEKQRTGDIGGLVALAETSFSQLLAGTREAGYELSLRHAARPLPRKLPTHNPIPPTAAGCPSKRCAHVRLQAARMCGFSSSRYFLVTTRPPIPPPPLSTAAGCRSRRCLPAWPQPPPATSWSPAPTCAAATARRSPQRPAVSAFRWVGE